MPIRVYSQTEEHRRKISLANTGKKRSEEFKKRLSLAYMGNKNPMYGKPSWNKGLTKETDKIIENMSKKIQGKNNHRWKGGRNYDGEGYILIKKRGHPFCNNAGYIREHRLVMEKKLGRYLKSNELVHHINNAKDDNRPENLMLVVRNKHWHPQTCPKCGFEFLIK